MGLKCLKSYNIKIPIIPYEIKDENDAPRISYFGIKQRFIKTFTIAPTNNAFISLA